MLVIRMIVYILANFTNRGSLGFIDEIFGGSIDRQHYFSDFFLGHWATIPLTQLLIFAIENLLLFVNCFAIDNAEIHSKLVDQANLKNQARSRFIIEPSDEYNSFIQSEEGNWTSGYESSD